MNRFPFLLARWESRQSLTRVGVYMLSISLGVAALVAVHSFREDVSRSIRGEARVIMGGDVRLSGRRALPDSVVRVVDSLTARGHRAAQVVTAPSMVMAPASGVTRLMQVRSVEGDWPFYGQVGTTPEGRWRDRSPGEVVVDPAVLIQMGVSLGDTLVVAGQAFPIGATVRNLPTSLGFQTAVGPRIYLTGAAMRGTGILGFGSLARYETYLEMPESGDQAQVETRYLEVFRETGVDFDTAEEVAGDLTDAVGFLGRYLGLVGLAALLLGGIGVGSAIHVFVKERLTEVAVLRCIGARQGSVFGAYLLQAAGLGLLGAAVGVMAGVAIQHLLPLALSSVLPVAVETRTSWTTVGWGMATGLWVSVIFALLPLLTIRDAPPLRALRQAMEVEGASVDRWRVAAVALLAASVLGLSMVEAPSAGEGLAFAGALGATTLVLWGVALLLVRATARLLPGEGPYTLRQGLSNLFRPRNQTVSVTLALGFGVFVVATVLLVRSNLARELVLEGGEGQPNLLLFDIQADQREAVVGLLPEEVRTRAEVTPLVPSRIRAINGVDRSGLDSLPGEERPRGWAVRREYRHTFRDTLTAAEVVVEGSWWDEAPRVESGVARISVEADVASDLGVGLGDRITWDVSGVPVESEVVSIRTVDWSRFQTNFFVVFEPGSLDDAPAAWVVLARMEGEEARAAFQGELVRRHPNVSVLDVSRIQEVVDGILAQVAQAIGFLAGFAALAGLLVLAGALATSRHQRLTEGALLRTLGARRSQILSILFTEYMALGLLGTLTGLVLAAAAAWGLVTQGFGIAFRADPVTLLGIAGAVSVLTLFSGLLGSRELLRRPPLPVLRGE